MKNIGIRTCLSCEPQTNTKDDNEKDEFVEFIYCHNCRNKAYSVERYSSHECVNNCDQSTENGDELFIDGVFLQENIITPEEETEIISSIDSYTWMDSQSGRRKQDFGPKINFKKKKINFTSFEGLPKIDINILDKIKNERIHNIPDNERFRWPEVNAFPTDECRNILRNFKTVEVCHLEYQ